MFLTKKVVAIGVVMIVTKVATTTSSMSIRFSFVLSLCMHHMLALAFTITNNVMMKIVV